MRQGRSAEALQLRQVKVLRMEYAMLDSLSSFPSQENIEVVHLALCIPLFKYYLKVFGFLSVLP